MRGGVNHVVDVSQFYPPMKAHIKRLNYSCSEENSHLNAACLLEGPFTLRVTWLKMLFLQSDLSDFQAIVKAAGPALQHLIVTITWGVLDSLLSLGELDLSCSTHLTSLLVHVPVDMVLILWLHGFLSRVDPTCGHIERISIHLQLTDMGSEGPSLTNLIDWAPIAQQLSRIAHSFKGPSSMVVTFYLDTIPRYVAHSRADAARQAMADLLQQHLQVLQTERCRLRMVRANIRHTSTIIQDTPFKHVTVTTLYDSEPNGVMIPDISILKEA
ncbi:hypothetical protein BKA93DRAFT_765076 [Sparassis latifolia]